MHVVTFTVGKTYVQSQPDNSGRSGHILECIEINDKSITFKDTIKGDTFAIAVNGQINYLPYEHKVTNGLSHTYREVKASHTTGDRIMVVAMKPSYRMATGIRVCDSPQRFGAKPGDVGSIIPTSIKLKGNAPMVMVKFDNKYEYKGKKRVYYTDTYWVHAESICTMITPTDSEKSTWDEITISPTAKEIIDDLSFLAENPSKLPDNVKYSQSIGRSLRNDAKMPNVSQVISSVPPPIGKLMYMDIKYSDEELAPIKINKKKSLLLL